MKYIDEFIKLIEQHSGLKFPETHTSYIIDSIQKELSSRKITEGAYLEILYKDNYARNLLFDRITINETYMFREERHFNIVAKFLKSIDFSKEAEIRFWSVTSSTGEEAISLAIQAEEYLPKSKTSYKVFATDLNSISLEHLRSGRIEENSLRFDGIAFRNLIEKHTIYTKMYRQLKPEILNHIQTYQKNLITDSIDEIMDNSIHIAFFRNTLVYMNEENKNKSIQKIVPKLRNNGYLFLASPEIPMVQNSELQIREDMNCFYFSKGLNQTPVQISRNAPVIYKIDNVESKVDKSKSKQRTESVNIRIVIDMLNQKTKIRQSSINSIVCFCVQEFLIRIQKNDLNRAFAQIQELEKYISDHELVYYLKGLYHYTQGETKNSISNYELSILSNSKFWISAFYLGLILKNDFPKKAIKYFKNVVYILGLEIKEQIFPYLFLMDNFDAMYYIKICENWIVRLSSEDDKNG